MVAKIMCTVNEYLETRIQIRGDCLLYMGLRDKDGYGVIHTTKFQEDYGTYRAPRLVWISNNGPISQGLVVMHSCDNPSCVNLEHLRLGTVADNNRDRKEKGRDANRKGENHGMSKLTDEKVRFIKRTAGIFRNKLIADLFELSDATVSLVRKEKRWGHI